MDLATESRVRDVQAPRGPVSTLSRGRRRREDRILAARAFDVVGKLPDVDVLRMVLAVVVRERHALAAALAIRDRRLGRLNDLVLAAERLDGAMERLPAEDARVFHRLRERDVKLVREVAGVTTPRDGHRLGINLDNAWGATRR